MREEWTDDRLDVLNREVADGFAEVGERFARVDQRFEQVDQRFDRVDEHLVRIDERFVRIDERFAEVNRRLGKVEDGIEALNGRFDGLQRTLFLGAVGVIAALLGTQL
jgi:hypothetical protein